MALIAFSCFGLACSALAKSLLTEEQELRTAPEEVVIHVNQVAYDQTAPKFAVLETIKRLPKPSRFRVEDSATSETVF